MDTVCRGLKFFFVYLDDILIASKTKAEHLLHLRELLSRLEQHGLVVNPRKCLFGKQKLDFLGHRINTPRKVKLNQPFP